MKKFNKFLMYLFFILFVITTTGCTSGNIINQSNVCNINNPVEDLEWLKYYIGNTTKLLEENNLSSSIKIYQCTMNTGEIGFIYVGDTWKNNTNDIWGYGHIYGCDGTLLCDDNIDVGVSDTILCIENIIDYNNKKLIWEINPYVCNFDNPLEDLQWLKNQVEEFIVYSDTSVRKRSFEIYQCAYTDRDGEKTGFIITPPIYSLRDDDSLVYDCRGNRVCWLSMAGSCDDFYITNKKLIWKIN